ncbi:MAG: hypothetical protein WC329_04445 [Candidatus Omnitrophota bacterium]|jgi:hypothetical protein
MAKCPVCDEEILIDGEEDEIEIGEDIDCPGCLALLFVSSVKPLEFSEQLEDENDFEHPGDYDDDDDFDWNDDYEGDED